MIVVILGGDSHWTDSVVVHYHCYSLLRDPVLREPMSYAHSDGPYYAVQIDAEASGKRAPLVETYVHDGQSGY